MGGFNTNTGLAESDVFYFGSRVGDTFIGATSVSTVTSAADELAARNNPAVNQPVTSLYDFNRDGVVSAADQLIARSSGGLLWMIDVVEVSEVLASAAAEPPIGGEPLDDSRAAIAFALATVDSANADEGDELDLVGWGRHRR